MRSSWRFFFSSRRRQTRWPRDWSSDVCSSDLIAAQYTKNQPRERDTLMIGNPAVMVVAPLVFNELNYDPQEDFTAVAEIGRASCREKVEVTACGEAVSGDDRQHESSDGQDRAT